VGSKQAKGVSLNGRAGGESRRVAGSIPATLHSSVLFSAQIADALFSRRRLYR